MEQSHSFKLKLTVITIRRKHRKIKQNRNMVWSKIWEDFQEQNYDTNVTRNDCKHVI